MLPHNQHLFLFTALFAPYGSFADGDYGILNVAVCFMYILSWEPSQGKTELLPLFGHH